MMVPDTSVQGSGTLIKQMFKKNNRSCSVRISVQPLMNIGSAVYVHTVWIFLNNCLIAQRNKVIVAGSENR